MGNFTFFRRIVVGMLALTLAVLTTGGAAWAQRHPWNNGDFRLNAEGRGEVRYEDRRRGDIERVGLYLRRDGRAELTLYQDRGQTAFFGRWRSENEERDRNPRLTLDLSGRFDGYAVTCRGRVSLQRSVQGLTEQWGVDDLELSGRDLEIRFRADATVGPSGGREGEYSGGYGDFTEYVGPVRGFGSFREGSDRRDVERVEVRLERGGRAEITAYGRSMVRFEGRWRRSRQGDVELRIDRAYGRDIREGRGRIEFRREAGRDLVPDRIELTGSGYREDFSLSFNNRDYDSGRGPETGGGVGAIEVDSSRPGRGRIRQDDRGEINIRRVAVNLTRTGRIQIVAESESGARYTFSGQCTRSRDGVFSIQLTTALNSNNASGRGTLYLRGRDLDRLDLDGSAGNSTFRMDFNAD